jgi:hypothetical protein
MDFAKENDKSWGDMTPTEKLSYLSQARENVCDEHDYEDSVNDMGYGTMLHQVCKVCFDIQGWIYTRE